MPVPNFEFADTLQSGAYTKERFPEQFASGSQPELVVVIGDSDGGAPPYNATEVPEKNRVYRYNNLTELKQWAIGGRAAEMMAFYMQPTDDLTSQKPSFVLHLRTNPATRSIWAAKDYLGSSILDHKSVQWGEIANQLAVKIEQGTSKGYKVSTKYRGSELATKDNVNYDQFTIQYVGIGSGATLEIDGITLKTFVTGAPEDNLTIVLAEYATMAALVAQINDQEAYVANLKGRDTSKPVELDVIDSLDELIETANGIKSSYGSHISDIADHTTGADATNIITAPDATDLATAITLITEMLTDYTAHDADAELVIGWAYHAAQESSDNSLASVSAPTDLETAISRASDLVSKFNSHDMDSVSHGVGSQYQTDSTVPDISVEHTVTADVQAYIDFINSQTGQIDVELAAGKVRTRLAYMPTFEFFTGGTHGVTDIEDWNGALELLQKFYINFIIVASGDPAVHSLVKSHCSEMSTPKVGKRRSFATGSDFAVTHDDSISAAKALGTGRGEYCYQTFWRNNPFNAEIPTEFPPYIGAALTSGLRFGNSVTTDATKKPVSILSLGYSPTSPEKEELLEGGISFFAEYGGRFVVAENVTLSRTENPILNSPMGLRVADVVSNYIEKRLIERMQGNYGTYGGISTLDYLKNTVFPEIIDRGWLTRYENLVENSRTATAIIYAYTGYIKLAERQYGIEASFLAETNV